MTPPPRDVNTLPLPYGEHAYGRCCAACTAGAHRRRCTRRARAAEPRRSLWRFATQKTGEMEATLLSPYVCSALGRGECGVCCGAHHETHSSRCRRVQGGGAEGGGGRRPPGCVPSTEAASTHAPTHTRTYRLCMAASCRITLSHWRTAQRSWPDQRGVPLLYCGATMGPSVTPLHRGARPRAAVPRTKRACTGNWCGRK